MTWSIVDQDVLSVFPDSAIHDAANKMVARNLRQVPVVSPENPKKMLGWLTLNDITRQQNSVEILCGGVAPSALLGQ